MDIRLVASDLDGTLLNENKQVSQRNREALYRAAEKGILFVPSTGRIWRALPQDILELPFLRYAIVVNGSGVSDCVEDTSLFTAEIPCQDAVALCEYMRQWNTYYDCYMDGKGFVEQRYFDRRHEFCLPAFAELIGRTREPVEDLAEHIRRSGDVQKLQMNFNDLELRRFIMDDLPKHFPQMVVTSALLNNLEVNIASATKGNALRRLCGHLGIDVAQTIAFGDGTNDISMLQAAGIGVAMANAPQEVKDAADRVTLTNEEDGIADFLEKYVL